jgi:hypothetical protein
MQLLQPDFETVRTINKSVNETLQFWGFVAILGIAYLVISFLFKLFNKKK